jgi:hypothetical protein
MGKFFKSHPVVSIICFLFIIIGVPLTIQLHFGFMYKLALWFTPGNHGNWMSFWGSYLGIISSVLVAIIVSKMEISANNKRENERFFTNKYIEDLKSIYKDLIDYKYDGSFKQINAISDIRLSEQSINHFKMKLFNQETFPGATIAILLRGNELYYVKGKINMLPNSKQERFQESINKLLNDLDEIHKTDGEKFDKFEQTADYLKVTYGSNSSEYWEHIKNWNKDSQKFLSSLKKFDNSYDKLRSIISEEVSRSYKLMS